MAAASSVPEMPQGKDLKVNCQTYAITAANQNIASFSLSLLR